MRELIMLNVSIDLLLDGEDFVSQTTFSTNKNYQNGKLIIYCTS